MLMFLLTVILPFVLTFEENQWIKEWLLLLDKYFIVSIQFHGIKNLPFNPAEMAFLRLGHNSTQYLKITKKNALDFVLQVILSFRSPFPTLRFSLKIKFFT